MMHRILIFGNSGSGKSTMARALVRERGLVHLDLDQLAWESPGVRQPLPQSAISIEAFIDAHAEWVIEGSYGDVIEVVLPFCSELRFLNPGVDACLANCRSRPWEPEKYASREAQDQMLDFLLAWVRDYETRTDEYSLRRHRRIFDAFEGTKLEITSCHPHDEGTDPSL